MLCRILRLTIPRLVCHFRLVVAVRVRESEREKKSNRFASIFSFPHHQPLALSVNESSAVFFSIRALDNL